MATVIEYLRGEQLTAGLLTGEEKKKLVVQDHRGRSTRIAADKVLFRHAAASVSALDRQRAELTAQLDVELLWEAAREETEDALETADLARLYFDASTPLHCSAVFHGLTAERLHFRRRGRAFQARSPQDVAQLREQQDAELRKEQERASLAKALDGELDDPELCARLERWLRGHGDRTLALALEGRTDPARFVFDRLVEAGHVPATLDLEVLQADLRETHPEAVLAHAAELSLPTADGEVLAAAFSIDDPETREVDDVLSVTADGAWTRVDIDIADVAQLVAHGDPVDREAQRRASTAYLPTGVYYMLPERVGCDLASLHAGEVRGAMRTSVWFDDSGQPVRQELSRVKIRVGQRLDYDTADALIATGEQPTADALRSLLALAQHCRAKRREAGAVSFHRPEWKIRVTADGSEISITPIPPASSSRLLVSEMMILANRIAAEEATARGIPVIYRVQPPPSGKVPTVEPDDPAAFQKLRGVISPASLSLEPGWHWGLGLRAYTQTTSPLRRYSDLIAQHQLGAALAGRAPPYGPQELLKALANAEATERELKRVEAVVTERWALEAIARLEDRSRLPGQVVADAPGGYKVTLSLSGATGILTTDSKHELGDNVLVSVKRVHPRRGVLRLQAAA